MSSRPSHSRHAPAGAASEAAAAGEFAAPAAAVFAVALAVRLIHLWQMRGTP